MVVRRYYDRPAAPAGDNPFRCEGFLHGGVIPHRGGGEVPLERLPPFLRALLVTDGTVTKILEAYFWEPVEVQTQSQEFVTAERPIPWIEVAAGDRVLARRARLAGRQSGTGYASAFSLIRTELIPETFRRRLVDREIGIGVLIRDSGLESYREVLDVGAESEPGDAEERRQRVFRTYRIIIGHEPVILITESFPIALYG
jgi:chorismate-pyruvate lyase